MGAGGILTLSKWVMKEVRLFKSQRLLKNDVVVVEEVDNDGNDDVRYMLDGDEYGIMANGKRLMLWLR